MESVGRSDIGQLTNPKILDRVKTNIKIAFLSKEKKKLIEDATQNLLKNIDPSNTDKKIIKNNIKKIAYDKLKQKKSRTKIDQYKNSESLEGDIFDNLPIQVKNHITTTRTFNEKKGYLGDLFKEIEEEFGINDEQVAKNITEDQKKTLKTEIQKAILDFKKGKDDNLELIIKGFKNSTPPVNYFNLIFAHLEKNGGVSPEILDAIRKHIKSKA